MSQSNIYALKDNGDLRLVAEIEGESDPALAVDALLDEMPRLKQRSFIVIDLDNVMTVEAGDEIVNPRREIKVSGYNGAVAAPASTEEDEDEGGEEDDNGEPEAEEQEEEAEAPKPAPRRRSSARKPAAKRSNGGGRTRSRAKSGSARKSPFKANAKSAE